MDNSNVPALRFAEFASTGSAQALGEWEEKTLSEHTISHKGGASLRPSDLVEFSKYEVIPKKAIIAGGILNLDKHNPTYSSEEFFNKSKTSQVDSSYLITTLRDLVPTAPSIGLIVTNPHDRKLLLAQGVHAFQVKDTLHPKFLTNLSNKESYRHLMYRLCVGSTQVHLRSTEFFKIKIAAPTLPEQKKIANFLSAVDSKIEQLGKKKALLEQYKKGVASTLLSTRMPFDKAQGKPNDSAQGKRFKQDNGEDYPDWEVKRLGDIAKTPSYGMNSAAISFDGLHKYIRITDIDEGSRKFKPSPLTSPDGKIDPTYKLEEGDVLFARTGASTGRSYIYDSEDGDVYFAGFLIRFRISKAHPKFIFFTTLTYSFKKWVVKMSMRSGQPGINAKEFSSYSFSIPCFKEQQKIANFLSSLDKKIEATQKQIEQTEAFKKGLLQKMFV